MAIDPATRASLEIERSQSRRARGLAARPPSTARSRAGGARLLAARLARPLLDPDAIDARLDAVEWLLEPPRACAGTCARALKGAGDMARALSRLALGRGGPRDLGCLRDGLRAAEALAALIAAAAASRWTRRRPRSPTPAARPARRRRRGAGGLRGDAGARASAPSCPPQARDGGFVAAGVRPELDEARALRDDSRQVVAALEARLQAETGAAAEDPPQRRARLFRRDSARPRPSRCCSRR